MPTISENCKLGLTEIQALIINDFKDEANEIWQNENHISREHIPSIRHGKYPLSKEFRNRNRLIMNKPFCMLKSNPTCEVCQTNLSVQHILIDCVMHGQERDILKGVYKDNNIEFTVRNILDLKQPPNIQRHSIAFINSLEDI